MSLAAAISVPGARSPSRIRDTSRCGAKLDIAERRSPAIRLQRSAPDTSGNDGACTLTRVPLRRAGRADVIGERPRRRISYSAGPAARHRVVGSWRWLVRLTHRRAAVAARQSGRPVSNLARWLLHHASRATAEQQLRHHPLEKKCRQFSRTASAWRVSQCPAETKCDLMNGITWGTRSRRWRETRREIRRGVCFDVESANGVLGVRNALR